MATQLTTTKGLSALAECWNRALATSSLPVPLSPWMSTVAPVPAARPMALYSSCMGREWPNRASPAVISWSWFICTGERMKRPASRAWCTSLAKSVGTRGWGHIVEGPQLGGLDGLGGESAGGGDDNR